MGAARGVPETAPSSVTDVHCALHNFTDISFEDVEP